MIVSAQLICDAMKTDTNQPIEKLGFVRHEVARLLVRCFDRYEKRPRAIDCKNCIEGVWQSVFDSPWTDFKRTLHPTKPSPCASKWNNNDRLAMLNQFSGRLLQFTMQRCWRAHQTKEQSKGPDDALECVKALQYYRDIAVHQERFYRAEAAQEKWRAPHWMPQQAWKPTASRKRKHTPSASRNKGANETPSSSPKKKKDSA